MNVSLGQKWEHFVEDRVNSGDYQTASEVLRDGLRLLEKEALLKQISVSSLPELEAKLLKAAESLDAGRGVDEEQVFARLRQRSKQRDAAPQKKTTGNGTTGLRRRSEVRKRKAESRN
jgi:antitoxin ParD1/3/4